MPAAPPPSATAEAKPGDRWGADRVPVAKPQSPPAVAVPVKATVPAIPDPVDPAEFNRASPAAPKPAGNGS